MLERYLWLVYVALAGLSWGVYVPLIFYGGSELKGPGGRFMAILCVGIAYFIIAVLVPLILFFSGQTPWPKTTAQGLIFSGLAGVAGAVGALCVIFATKSAVAAAEDTSVNYKLYIAPLIFGLAPVINTLVSIVWHPKGNDWLNFGLGDLPGWKLWLGIVLVGAGAALVLFSKEEAEAGHAPKAPPATVTAAPPSPGIQESPR
jgi:drug/metabolite transporter (DMT)-like permease